MAHLGLVTLVVRDYDEAIAFYVDALGFTVVEDSVVDEHQRWVVVAPPGDGGAALLLARASTSEQLARVGDQTGGTPAMVLYCDDLDTDVATVERAGGALVRRGEDASARSAHVRDPAGNVIVLAQLL